MMDIFYAVALISSAFLIVFLAFPCYNRQSYPAIYWEYRHIGKGLIIMNNKRRSQRMENAALLLGVIGAATFCMVYPALICGSLAIVFALLSRGGERTLTSRAKAALILGSIALGIVLAMIIYTFAIAELYYGGVENMARQVYGTLGIDFDTLMNSLAQ